MSTIFIPVRDLEITDGDNPSNWQWFTLPDGDEEEVAKLVGDNELDIKGAIGTRRLTEPPYRVYLVFKLEKNHKNIDKAYAAVGTTEKSKGHLLSLAKKPRLRNDQWYEVALGDYRAKGGNELPMLLWGTDDSSDKYGLIVKGIEIRPKP